MSGIIENVCAHPQGWSGDQFRNNNINRSVDQSRKQVSNQSIDKANDRSIDPGKGFYAWKM
jgi:hypothetical protein